MGTEAGLDKDPLQVARDKIQLASRRGGANERRLTDVMCALLSTDESAARSVVNLLLDQCDERRVMRALGVRHLRRPVRVLGERAYGARASGLSRRKRPRRFDLLFVAGSRAVAVEAKLGASLADRQLEDLLGVDVEQFELDPSARLGAIVLGPRELELGGIKDPRGRLLKQGVVRWSAIIEQITAIGFQDAATEQAWREDLFGLYRRRGAFGPSSLTRPTPRGALEALAVPLRDRVQAIVGESHVVRLDANRGLHVTAGRQGVANIELVIERRRRPRRERRVTIWLEVPRGGRRTATISRSNAPDDDRQFGAPAALEPLEALLTTKLEEIGPRL